MSTPASQGFPLNTQKFVDGAGNITAPWRQFLVNLWSRTGGSGSLAALFSASSGIAVSVSGVNVLITGSRASLTDVRYGGKADGVADDTAAWNRVIADFNSGLITSVLVPGRSLVTGALNPVVTAEKQIEIVGFGPRNSCIQQTSAADVTTLSVTVSGFGGKVNFEDFSVISSARGGQAIYIHTLPNCAVSMSNMEIAGYPDRRSGGFTRGIEMVNVTSSTFTNVNVQGWKSADPAVPWPTRWQNSDWGWYVHADIGQSTTNNRWISCDILYEKVGWKCDSGNVQGFFWTDCTPAWVGIGWKIEMTDGTLGPCFGWHGGSPECFHNGITAKNVAYLDISGLTFLMDEEYAEVRQTVLLTDCYQADVHDNMLVNIGALSGVNLGTCDFIISVNTDQVQTSNNQCAGLDGYGVRFTGTSARCTSTGDKFYFPAASGVPFKNDSANAITNKRRSMDIPGGTAAQGGSPQTNKDEVAGTLSTVQTPYIQLLMGVEIGDKVRISTAGFLEYTVGEASPQMVVREYNHRPASGSPFTILNRANNRINFINWFHLTADKGQEYLDREFTFDVVAAATDALFSLELHSAGALGNTCKFDRVSMTVERL